MWFRGWIRETGVHGVHRVMLHQQSLAGSLYSIGYVHLQLSLGMLSFTYRYIVLLTEPLIQAVFAPSKSVIDSVLYVEMNYAALRIR